MKKIVLTFSTVILVLGTLRAQTSPQFPGTAPGLPASPVNSGLPGSPVNQGLPGFNNSFGPFFTNQFGNGFGSTALNQLLIQLQFELTQIYPVIVDINNSFDFTAGGTNALGTNGNFGTAGIASPNPPGTINTRNASTLLSSSAAGNFGTSLGQDLSGIIGGRAAALGNRSTTMNGGVSTAISPVAGATGTTAAGSAVVTSGLAFSSTRDVLRALLLLQDDIERMLPLVNGLNGGNIGSLNTLFTNNLGVVTNSAFMNGSVGVTGTSPRNPAGTTTSSTTTRSTTLAPTGR